MKFLVLSDIHSDYFAAASAYDVEKPDFVLDCGDHEDIKNIFGFTPHFYIHGNHEPNIISSKKDDMPLPFYVNETKIMNLSDGVDILRVSGLGGNYAPADKTYSVKKENIDGLREIPDSNLDVLLLHESPLEVSENSNFYSLARKVVNEIDRIRPRLVFSGHKGRYGEKISPGGVRVVTLDDMAKGYGVLNFCGEDLKFERKIARFE